MSIVRARRAAACAALTAGGYVLAFAALYPVLGPSACALATLPALAAGWRFGPRAGAAAAVVGLAANTGLLHLFGVGGGSVFAAGGPFLVAAAAGLAAGWAGRSRDALRAELAQARRAEGALRDGEERYRLLFQANPQPMWVYDVETLHFLAVNDAAVARYGYTRDEFLSMTLADIRPAEDVPAFLDRVRRLAADLAGAGVWRHRWKDGTVREVEIATHTLIYLDRPARLVLATDVTDRRRAEAALRESEARLARAQRAAGLGGWELDLDTGRLSWTEEVYRLFGVRPGEFTPTRAGFRALVHPDDRPRVAAAVEAALARGEPHDFDHRVVLPGGAVRVLHERAEVVRDAAGRPARLLGTVQDVTDRRAAEAALRESETQFRRLFEDSPLGIYRTTPDGRVLLANPAAVRMAGCRSFAELAARDLNTHKMHPDYPRDEFMRRLERDGEIRGLEVACRRWDGEAVYLRENARAVRSPDGAILYYEGTLEDVTDRKRAEAALREREALLQTIIAHIPCGVFWKDRASAYLGCNDRVARDCGFASPAELVGKTDRDLAYRPEEAAFYQECDRRVVETGEPLLGIEEPQTRADGTTAVLLTSKVPLRDAAGAVVGVLGIYQDVTDAKRLQEQVRQKQKMEAVGQLAGGVAHDFNNLLTVINGYAELLLETLSPADPARGSVAEIRRAGNRAGELTRQLLAFGRRQLLEPRVLDLNEAVGETAVMLRRLIGEDVELTTALAPGLWRVKVDPGQLERVLVNLCVNARDAMPTGGRLTIETENVVLDDEAARAHPDLAPGAYVLLAVSDTGHGMTDEVKSRIFEPFFTTKGPGEGTGLGLATVYGVVQQSGGAVTVYSEPGVGTTFKVYLPRAEGALPAPARRRAGALPGGTETVLVAEDEPAVRALARQVLQGCGYTVLEAEDGEAAARLADAHPGPIHLLVTDVVMPRLGGRQLAERLRGRRPGLRVLFMSGYTDDAVVRHGVLEADVAFVPKPFAPAALAQKVRAVLDGSRPPTPLSPADVDTVLN